MISIRRIRNRLKNALLRLPLGLGTHLIIAPLKFGLSLIHFPSKLILIYRRKQISQKEATRILSRIQNDTKRAIIVYDNLSSAPSYGDFLYVVMIARYFIMKKMSVTFFIIDSEFRFDWESRLGNKKIDFVERQLELAKKVLDANYCKIKQLSWSECIVRIKEEKNISIIPFYENIVNRRSIYQHSFNLSNILFSKLNRVQLDNVLFSKNEFSNKGLISGIKNNYITWGVRCSIKDQYHRNLTDEEFISNYDRLLNKFPNHKIVIVSDKIGCDYFSIVARKNSLDCTFSKPFTRNFFEDGLLILNSDFFFQIRGGGISTFALMSNIPYEMSMKMIHELMWSRKKATSWQTDEQIFNNADNLAKDIFLKCN